MMILLLPYFIFFYKMLDEKLEICDPLEGENVPRNNGRCKFPASHAKFSSPHATLDIFFSSVSQNAGSSE
jgi:hypothetical protein